MMGGMVRNWMDDGGMRRYCGGMIGSGGGG